MSIDQILFGIPLHLLTVFVVSILVWKKLVSSRVIAGVGFMFLFFAMVCSLFKNEALAGNFAEYTWIFFVIAFVAQLLFFLKYENK